MNPREASRPDDVGGEGSRAAGARPTDTGPDPLRAAAAAATRGRAHGRAPSEDPAWQPPVPLHGLNENHRRHLVSSVQHALKLLRDCSDALAAGEAATGPARYRRPLVEPVRSEVQEGLLQLQTRLIAVLESLGLALPAPTLDAAAAVRVGLLALDITCEEMAGRHMRGYGVLPPETEQALDAMAGQLRDLVRSVATLLPAAGTTDDSGTGAAEDGATRPPTPPVPGPSPRATGDGDDGDPGDDTVE